MLREQTLLILLGLADGPRHGYGLIAAVADLSGGTVRIGPGTLYGALDRLTAHGLVEMSGSEVVEGRTRRYYRLTPDGVAAVRAESDRLSQLARRARGAVARLA